MRQTAKTSPVVVVFVALVAATLGAALTVAILHRGRSEALRDQAIREQQRADQAIAAARSKSNQANRAREQAEELVDFILEDLRTELLPLGRTELLSAAGERAAAYFENLPSDQVTPESEFNRAKVLVTIGQALTDQGDFPAAEKRFRAGIGILERWGESALEKEDLESWKYELGWSLSEFGILLDKQRDFEEAERVNQQALEVFQELLNDAENKPADWVYGIAAARFGLASAAAGRGDKSTALQLFEETADAAREALEFEPGHVLSMQVLAISLNDAGLTHQRSKDFANAIPILQSGCSAMRELILRDPGSRRWEKELATGLNNIGISLDALERYEEAESYLKEALTLRQGLAAWDSRNGSWLANLANSWHNLAALYFDLEQDDQAQQAALDSLNVYHQLTVLEPGNVSWRADMKQSHESLGRILQKQSRPEAARDLYHALISRGQELIDENGSLRPWEDRLMTLHRLLVDAERKCGADAKDVLPHWRSAALVRTRAFAANPDSHGARRRLGTAIARLGDAAREADDHELELQCFSLAHYLIASVEETTSNDRTRELAARDHALALGLKTRIVIPSGSVWRYSEARQQPGDWATIDFDDSQWQTGAAPLGYGDGDERTILSFGDGASNKPMTAWFRKTIEVDQSIHGEPLHLGIVCDDGAVLYLNGEEIVRHGMPEGKITSETPAAVTAREPAEHDFNPHTLKAEQLQWHSGGKNVIAVEIHQNEPISSDLRFDLELMSALPEVQPLDGFDLKKAKDRSSLLFGLLTDFLIEELEIVLRNPKP